MTKTSFLHVADCHLGKWQYNQRERFNDFGRAFHYIVDAAIEAKVDFVVLAGDLFEKRSIDALTLNQAMRALDKLHNKGIPCLAIEGNHERPYFSEQVGWMEFLAVRDLLILLTPTFEEGKAQLAPYKIGVAPMSTQSLACACMGCAISARGRQPRLKPMPTR